MKTIVGLFDTFDEAKKAAQDLENAGIGHNDISIVANNETGAYAANSTDTTTTGTPSVSGHAIGHDAVAGAEIGGVAGLLLGLTGLAIPGLGWIATAGWLGGMLLGAATGAAVGGLVGAFTSVGVPEEDAQHYTEAVRRGGILLAVRSQDEQAQRVAEILGEDGAVNIDERVEQYRSQGYVPGAAAAATTATAATMNTTTTATAPIATQTVNTAGETVLPVVEEQIALGKREVQSGGVRVYSHVTETPVQESINLREEHVTVERHAVDRPVDAATMNNLRDGVIEVTETAEVPVVAKEARVVEEVVVGKQATERTETVHDTVRRTDVEVEQIAGQTTTTGTTFGTAGTTAGHTARDIAATASGAVQSTEGSIPGVQTGGHAVDGSGAPDTRGIMEKAADTITGNHVDDKTGRPV